MSRRSAERHRGSATVEAVVLVPAAMLALLVVLQVGLWALAAEAVQQVADRAALAAASLGAGPPDGQQAARAALAGMAGRLVIDPSVTVTASGSNADDVVVTGQVESLVPGWHPAVTARRQATVQRFRAGVGP